MHASLHTYDTRAIECSVQSKVLQKLLWHANVKTTTNMCFHVTDKLLSISYTKLKRQHQLVKKNGFKKGVLKIRERLNS